MRILLPKTLSVVKWSVQPFKNAFKKSSVEVWEPYCTDLERVASRTLDKTQRAIGKYNFFIIDEQSIITLYLFCYCNAMQN
jgi:hypothetical protein